MRILLAFEEEYRLYMEALAGAIRAFRSEVEVVVVANLEELGPEVERLNPQLVILNYPAPNNLGDDQLSRIELSTDPEQPSRFRVGQRSWESTNPTLGEILPVIEETSRGKPSRVCWSNEMFYRIVVEGELTERFAGAFEGMKMEAESGQTIITGQVVDQSHLHGILNRISSLGLQLVSVQALAEEPERGS